MLASFGTRQVEYRILGPLEVFAGRRPLHLAGYRQRAVLANLLLHANEVVSSDRLLDARGALLDQRRRGSERALAERDDDSDQLRLLAHDRRCEQLVQLTKHAKPDRAHSQRRPTPPLDP